MLGEALTTFPDIVTYMEAPAPEFENAVTWASRYREPVDAIHGVVPTN